MASRYWVGGSGTWNTTSTIHWSATSGGAAGASVPTTADTVIFNASSGTGTCTTATGATCSTITKNSTNLVLTLGANLTITSSFTLIFGALNLSSFKLSCAIFSSSNTNLRSIAFGTGNITVTGSGTVWNSATVSNFTTTGTKVVNVTNITTTLTIVNAGAINEANAISFNFPNGAYLLYALGSFKNIDFTGFSGGLDNFSKTIYGNYTVSATMSILGGGNPTTFSATSGIQTLTSNGVTFEHPLIINNVGATLKTQDALTCTGGINFNGGVLDLNSNTLTTFYFTTSSTVATTTTNVFGGIVIIGTDFNVQNGAITTLNSPNITFSDSAITAKTFRTGGLTYGNLSFVGSNDYILSILDSPTFDTVSSSKTSAFTISLTAGITVTTTNWNVSGTAGNVVTLNSLTVGTQATISQASGIVDVNYCSIQDNNATGGSTFNALLTNGNTDLGNNTGWDFNAIVSTSNMLIMF